jgi:membrane protein implicated in regulation of membrane protease activity
VARFRVPGAGNAGRMIGLGIALLVIGVVTLFFMPWVGIPAAIVGLILVVLFFLGFGKRAARDTTVSDRRI